MYGRDRFNRVAPRHKKTRAVAQCRETCLGPRLGPRMAVSRWPSDWRGDLHLVRSVRQPTGFFALLCHLSKKRYISAARANYRKLPLGRLFLMALPGCMPSLEQPGQPGAEIRVLRTLDHSAGLNICS